jgi:hypothetical protein
MSEPKWAHCVHRQEIVRFNKDGTKTPAARCAHQACSRFNTDLTPADCAGCPLRNISGLRPAHGDARVHKREYAEPRIVDGKLVYEETDKKPPSVPAGYQRSEDAWVFLPLWLPCEDREMAATVQRCGQLKMNPMCGSRKCGRYGLPITPEVCEGCPVRRVS